MIKAALQIALVSIVLALPLNAAAKEPTPRETYELYLATIDKAASVDEVMDFYSNGVKKKISASSNPSELKTFWRTEKESARVQPEKLIEEKITGQTAILVYDIRNQVSGPNEVKSAITKIHMKRENGKWKIDSQETSVNTKWNPIIDESSGIDSYQVPSGTEKVSGIKVFETGLLQDEMGFVDKSTGTKVDIVTNMMGIKNPRTGKTDWRQRYVALVVPVTKEKIRRVTVEDVDKRPIKMASPPVLIVEETGSERSKTMIKLSLYKKAGFEFRLKLETTK